MASGSAALDTIVAKLKGSSDPKRRYEYVLWLAKKLPAPPAELSSDASASAAADLVRAAGLHHAHQ